MTDGHWLLLIVMFGLFYGKIHGIRAQLTRIADFCERAEKRMARPVE